MGLRGGRGIADGPVLVLGGRSEMGIQVARRLAAGRTVILAARRHGDLDGEIATLRDAGATDVHTVEFDADDTASHPALLEKIDAEHGGIGVAVLAFGVLGDQARAEQDPAHALAVAHTDYLAQISVLTTLANLMRARGSGQLVVFKLGGGRAGAPRQLRLRVGQGRTRRIRDRIVGCPARQRRSAAAAASRFRHRAHDRGHGTGPAVEHRRSGRRRGGPWPASWLRPRVGASDLPADLRRRPFRPAIGLASDAAVTKVWPGPPIAVIGIGADGWDGLGATARREIAACEVLFGSPRQLALIPDDVTGERMRWPSPLVPALPGLLETNAGARIGVLASGDPMYYGIGVTLARLVGARALRVFPQPSSVSLACARLGWPLADVPVVSVVGRPLATVLPELGDGRRILVLSADQHTPAALAELLRDNGFGASNLTVLEQLGGPDECLASGVAAEWRRGEGDPLNIVAIECVGDPARARTTRVPGLPDEMYSGDGQLTKSEVRALTLAALTPAPGELLWDIGGGSGTIAIEWCRTHPACRAVTFEQHEARRRQIAGNAAALGVPQVVVRGAAPRNWRSWPPNPDHPT